MAGQDIINIDIKINQPKLDQNNSLTINLPDAGESKNYQINTGKTKIFSNNAGSQSYWDITAVDHNDNSQLVAVWNNSISKDSPDYLDLTIPALANGSTVKSDLKNQAFNVEIDGKSQIAFTADLTPYKDKVTPTELIHGFAMGQKSFN